jgi:4-hydroxy-tetrahydrodipicolinate synthase
MVTNKWFGVFPATLCPFHEDYSVDEDGLQSYLRWIVSHPGVKGIVTNGHTGEIMSLRPVERAQVTRLAVEAVGASVPVVSGVSADGSLEAIDHAIAAREAGADAILLMPPHHWLRFGRSSRTAVGFVQDVAKGSGVSIIVHQYPAWTKAGYTLDEMLQMVNIPEVVSIKMGTRDMARQAYDYQALKQAAPHISILTCHDEYLLPSLLEGADGALVGFAGLAPDLIVNLCQAALEGDLAASNQMRTRVDELARAVYNFGEPSSEAHQRMKMAAFLLGRISSPLVRPPLRPLSKADIQSIRARLLSAGQHLTQEGAETQLLS